MEGEEGGGGEGLRWNRSCVWGGAGCVFELCIPVYK